MATAVDPGHEPITHEVAEQGLLGALIVYGDWRHVKRAQAVGLRPEHFYWERHQVTFEAAVSLAERKMMIDPIILSAECEALHRKPLKPATLEGFASCVPTAGNYLEYAQRVVMVARWRARQTAWFTMGEAIARKDAGIWRHATSILRDFELAIAPTELAPEPEPPRLRLVVDGDSKMFANIETGEVVAPPKGCEDCRELDMQLKGAEKEIRRLRRDVAKLSEDREAAALQDGRWLTVQLLFEHWKTLTHRKGSKFDVKRFELCAPLLTKYGLSRCEQAIAGIAFDPWRDTNRNGKEVVYNDWETVFKNAGSLARYAGKAPNDWKATLVDRTQRPQVAESA